MTPTGPAAPAASADVSSAPSEFEAGVGELFGDFTSSGGESPEPESTSAAGTTPAEPAAGTDSETGTPDAAAGDDATRGASDGTTPETPPADATAELDPFADTTPLTFVVNGQPMTNEGIRVFKEGGAVIRPEALPDIQNRLAERESLFARNRAQSVEYQTLAKALEWTDDAGKTFSGPEAAIELRITGAGLFAENKLLVDTLTDPTRLASILALEDVPDGKGGVTQRIVVNPDALKTLQRENSLQQRELTAQIRDHYKGVLAEASKPQAPAIDFTAEAPRLIGAIATTLKLDVSLLTAGDRKILSEALPDQTKNGLASVVWQGWVKDRLQDRAQQKAASTTLVESTTRAAKEGAVRMAAAARGVKQTPKPVVVAPKVPTPQQERATNEGELVDLLLSSGASALRTAR